MVTSGYKAYEALGYETPAVLKDKHLGRSCLIIGSGTSTKDLISYKNKIRNKFDVVIGINLTTMEFEEQMDYHLIVEKNPEKMYKPMSDGTHKYRKDLPRVLNWKAIRHFPKDIKIYKLIRCSFGGKPNIIEYSYGGYEGLLTGPQDKTGLSAGTATMQAFHLACIMGCKKIFLVGADLMFKGQDDHFYKDNQFYRKSLTKIGNRSPVVKLGNIETTEFFLNSAGFIDSIVEKLCKSAGIDVYDFSGGLLKKPQKLDIHEFFKDK